MSKSKSRTWNIGEYAVGGIIEARVTNEERGYRLVEVKARDANNKDRIVLADWAETDHIKWYNTIMNTLNEMTSVYHADIIMQWITKQVKQFDNQLNTI